MQYLVKQRTKQEAEKGYENQQYLTWRIDSIYKQLDGLYGTQKLILMASQLEVIDLMNSDKLEERLVALQKLLLQVPSDNELKAENSPAILDRLEACLAEVRGRREVEEELQQRIQDKINQNYNNYVKEIKLQVLKEKDTAIENAQTLKKLGQLEKMERINLSCSALEILRPSTLAEIIGQEKAIKSLTAQMNSPFPQHILLYGPPGVGKTTCARLALEMVKGRKNSPFALEAPFIEVNGTTLRWDPREATNPLLGSVHDPIYQGARKELAEDGIPEPKMGLVSEAHGGILFIDEIGDMDPALQNKLLKVLEDKRVYFESSYYDPHDTRIPSYIKQMFDQGVPADFILIGATTRHREDINPALRSRCMEIFFEPLTVEHIIKIINLSAAKLKIEVEAPVGEIIGNYTTDGRSANKILIDAFALALNQDRTHSLPVKVTTGHVYEAIQNSRITPNVCCRASERWELGRIFGIGASGYQGCLIEIESIAFPVSAASGNIRFNETAGSMARDSVFNAASVLRKETGEKIKDYDLHINIVGGGRVDGPSAGAAIYLAIMSAVKGLPVRQDTAITGELSIQGQVKPVGALYEKIYGARQAGIKKILIPLDNYKDIPHVNGIHIVPIKDIAEAYPHFFKMEEQEDYLAGN